MVRPRSSRVLKETSGDRRQQLLSICLEYLERYYVLITFTSFVMSPKFRRGGGDGELSFEQWVGGRPELYSILQRMLRRNPIAALSLNHPSLERRTSNRHIEAAHSGDQTPVNEGEEEADEMALALARHVAVLAPASLLERSNRGATPNACFPCHAGATARCLALTLC